MKESQRKLIEEHGRNVLRIFPKATERDPVALCKKLRRIEREAASIGFRFCNGPEITEAELDARVAKIRAKLNRLLGPSSVPLFVNLDPRGYALKIRDEWMRERPTIKLHRDWGGYGILAPEIK